MRWVKSLRTNLLAEAAVDVLSEVLSVVRLTGAVYFDVQAKAPWVAETPPASRIGADVMPDFEHVIAFHVLIDGACYAQLADTSEPPVQMAPGDAILFAGGDAHFLGTQPGKRAALNLDLYRRVRERPWPFIIDELGGHGPPARLACGFLGCDARPFNPIIGALPRTLHVRGSGPSGRLISDLIHVALGEVKLPKAGGQGFLAKLSELLFLHAVRQHVDSLEPETTGWLAGLRDPQISCALRLMHERPAAAWTLEKLARGTGMSRSTFAERFSVVMGMTPIQYLGNWRLQLAARLLEHDSLSIAETASKVGYESEAAFNRAFKRLVGSPPGAWRKRRSGERAAPLEACLEQRPGD